MQTSSQSARAYRSDARWAGVRLSLYDRVSFVDALKAAVSTRDGLRVTFLNPFYARATAANEELAEVVDGFDVVQPDGWGVVYGARLAGIRVPERVAIEDVERPLFEWLAARGAGVFLFGSRPGVVEEAARVLAEAFPGLTVAGTHHGWIDVEAGHPGRIDDSDARGVAQMVRDSEAEVVMVGLPTPLQQYWAAEYAPMLDHAVVMTVGAYFDKLAEGLDWYPRWMERARLGWLYRVYREPGRLTGRYTLGALSFAGLVILNAVKSRRRRVQAPLEQ